MFKMSKLNRKFVTIFGISMINIFKKVQTCLILVYKFVKCWEFGRILFGMDGESNGRVQSIKSFLSRHLRTTKNNNDLEFIWYNVFHQYAENIDGYMLIIRKRNFYWLQWRMTEHRIKLTMCWLLIHNEFFSTLCLPPCIYCSSKCT